MKIKFLITTMVIASLFGCRSGESSDIREEVIIDKSARTAISDGHNSRNSLDWEGVYEGSSYCTDCDKVKTLLRLNADETFVLSQAYVRDGKEEMHYKDNGTFTWDENGSHIIVDSGDITIRFQVRENEIRLLDMKGNVVDAKLENFYTLKKQ